MNTEIINVLNDNCIQKFDLEKQLEKYIEIKQKDYLHELVENNFHILPWRKLELITAYKNKALMYEDVPEYIKEKHNLPTRDEGIDVIKIENGKIIKVYQCKCYIQKTICKSDLHSFYQYQQIKYNLTDVEFIITCALTTKINKSIIHIKYDIDEEFQIEEIQDDINIIKPISLREYQKESIEKIQYAFENDLKSINIKIPCGCGKTMIIYHYGVSNYNILIVVPKISIAEQIYYTFRRVYNKKINHYWTNHCKDNHSNVTLCVYNSIDYVIKQKFDMIFIDEAHHMFGTKIYPKYLIKINEYINTEEQMTYINKILNVNNRLTINLSATIDIRDENDYEYKFDKAIDDGYLTNYEINILYVDSLFNRNTNNDYRQIVNIINSNKEYKHIIIYCNHIETAENCNKILNENNIISYVLTSEIKLKKRERQLNDFRNGLVRVICSVNCLNEGTDLPIADTCMFLNDRQGEINIIQCIGRVLRLYKYKNKARIVLFDVTPSEANNKGDYYLRTLNKYDNFFKSDLRKRIKIYDHTSEQKINIKLIESIYFDKITKFRLTWNQKTQLIQEYIQEFGNEWPAVDTIYKNWAIGRYIADLKYKLNNEKMEIIEKMFNRKRVLKEQLSNEQILELCRQFVNLYHRIPKCKEMFDGYKLGNLIHRISVQNQHQDIKNEIEKIFNQKIEPKCKKNTFTNEQIIEYNQRFYSKYKRLPKQDEIIDGYKIGCFINRLKEGQTPHLKDQIESIYGQIIKVNKQHVEYEKRNDELKFKSCEEFYNKYQRMPTASHEDQENAGFNIYDFISNTLKSNNIERRNKIINIFNLDDDYLNRSKQKRVRNEEDANIYVKTIVKYYKIFKTIPTNSRKPVVYDGIDITKLYLNAKSKRGVGIYVRKALEEEGYVFENQKEIEDDELINENLGPIDKLKYYDEALKNKHKITSTNKWYIYTNKAGIRCKVDLYDFKQDIKNHKSNYWKEFLPKVLEIEKKYNIETEVKVRYSQEQQIEFFKLFYKLYHRMPVKYDGKDYLEVEINNTKRRYDIGARYKQIMKRSFIEKNKEFVTLIENIPNEK